MVKSVLYTKNPNFVPSSLEQVIKYAYENDILYNYHADEDSKLFNIEKGAKITTSKGNVLYVLEVADGMVEYDGKSSGISGIVDVEYPFGKPNKPRANCSIKNIGQRMRDMFMPKEAEDIRIAQDGNICVATKNGYVAINDKNQLISYPSELTFGFLPAFIISKPSTQLQVGDILALDKSYVKVTEINGDKITGIGYTGSGRTIHTITDALFNQSMVRVVVSMAGNLGNMGVNPLLLMALSEKGSNKKDSLLPLLMMSQQNAAMQMNPMLMMALGGDDFDMKDFFMMSALSGNQNPFGAMFGQAPIEKKD